MIKELHIFQLGRTIGTFTVNNTSFISGESIQQRVVLYAFRIKSRRGRKLFD